MSEKKVMLSVASRLHNLGLEDPQRGPAVWGRPFVHVPTHSIVDHSESADAVEAPLQKITEGRYVSPRKLDQLLRSLPGVNARLPETELRRLESLLPRTLSSGTIRKLELLRERTEGHLPPYIQQIPATIIVDGKEKGFTLSAFEAIWERMEGLWDPDRLLHNTIWIHQTNSADLSVALKRTRENTLGMYLTDSVTKEIKHKVWRDGTLRAYSAGCLAGSKLMPYFEQLRYQREVLGKGSAVGVDAFFPVLFRNLASGTKEGLMMNGPQRRWNKKGDTWMRVNDMTAEGPYIIASDSGSLFVEAYPCHAAGGHGIGASFEIPKE